MRGGALPPALLMAALGFALAFAPRGAWSRAVLAAALTSAATWVALGNGRGAPLEEVAFLGLWGSIAITAVLVHMPRGPSHMLALAAGANAGLWSGAVVAVAGKPIDLAIALPCTLLCFVARPIIARGLGVGVKVAASWLIAVAILAALLPLTPTPGYRPDHMD
jgi:hypothetical protein